MRIPIGFAVRGGCFFVPAWRCAGVRRLCVYAVPLPVRVARSRLYSGCRCCEQWCTAGHNRMKSNPHRGVFTRRRWLVGLSTADDRRCFGNSVLAVCHTEYGRMCPYCTTPYFRRLTLRRDFSRKISTVLRQILGQVLEQS